MNYGRLLSTILRVLEDTPKTQNPTEDNPSVVYDRYRQDLSCEDNLINQRLHWHFTAQAFLFAALGVSIQQKINELTQLVIIVGLVSSALILVSISAAILSFIRYLRLLEDHRLLKTHDKKDYPQMNRKHKIIYLGFVAPIGLPILFIVAWVLALCWLWP